MPQSRFIDQKIAKTHPLLTLISTLQARSVAESFRFR